MGSEPSYEDVMNTVVNDALLASGGTDAAFNTKMREWVLNCLNQGLITEKVARALTINFPDPFFVAAQRVADGRA